MMQFDIYIVHKSNFMIKQLICNLGRMENDVENEVEKVDTE